MVDAVRRNGEVLVGSPEAEDQDLLSRRPPGAWPAPPRLVKTPEQLHAISTPMSPHPQPWPDRAPCRTLNLLAIDDHGAVARLGRATEATVPPYRISAGARWSSRRPPRGWGGFEKKKNGPRTFPGRRGRIRRCTKHETADPAEAVDSPFHSQWNLPPAFGLRVGEEKETTAFIPDNGGWAIRPAVSATIAKDHSFAACGASAHRIDGDAEMAVELAIGRALARIRSYPTKAPSGPIRASQPQRNRRPSNPRADRAVAQHHRRDSRRPGRGSAR